MITPAELSSQLHGQEQTQFLKSAILLAWADGEVTPQERKLLDAFAVAFGIAPAALTTLEAEMKAYLLEHLAHLHNTGEFKRVT